ncbi:glycosyl hydrolase family 18 protein, partial [Salmonella enterica subsp. enterica serovar 1,4,[5],12:i:-]|nr:glycosyl hydrolase family 18 protein [Salmonella enterica subsp. enterica serovar 1,4,[5],12:i:-]
LLAGTPPLLADGPGEKGPHTKVEGMMSYPEICVKLVSPTNPTAPAGMLRRMSDPERKLGSYGFRLYDKKSGEDGFWVGFEDVESATAKAQWAKSRGLGGVAVLDIGLDDARGICDGSKFPITAAVKRNL